MTPPATTAVTPTAAPAGVGEEARVEGQSGSAGEGEAAGEAPSTEQARWLVMSKNSAQARCKELESLLASTREELTKRETRLVLERERCRRGADCREDGHAGARQVIFET